jgi:hypothetical protein
MSQGECLIIQDDTRHDNGVWLSGKCIIDEVDYTDHTITGKVDTRKRNELIESWMEKNGYFPGVFRCDCYGNVYHVNTQDKE